MFKEYEKEYENYLTKPRSLNKCKIEDVGNVLGISTREYMLMMRKHCRQYQKFMWDWMVKMIWLSNKFTYKEYRKKHSFIRSNGYMVDAGYGVFMRKFVGHDPRMYKMGNVYKIVTYFYDFYPEFDDGDPFKNKYEYPYKRVTFDDLILLHQMDERLDLLNVKEKSRMSYVDFVDYIINYVNCLNNDIGRLKYRFEDSKRCDYVIDGYHFRRQGAFVKNMDKLSYEKRQQIKIPEASDIY